MNASPSIAIFRPRSGPRCRSSLPDPPALLQLVHLDHRRQQLKVVPRVAGQLLQRLHVLGEAVVHDQAAAGHGTTCPPPAPPASRRSVQVARPPRAVHRHPGDAPAPSGSRQRGRRGRPAPGSRVDTAAARLTTQRYPHALGQLAAQHRCAVPLDLVEHYERVVGGARSRPRARSRTCDRPQPGPS